jgi:hypothetical protein
MSSAAGRIIRIVAGVAIIAWGYSIRDTTAGVVWMVVGLVPLIAGAFNLCFLGLLFGAPLSGAKIAGGGRKP